MGDRGAPNSSGRPRSTTVKLVAVAAAALFATLLALVLVAVGRGDDPVEVSSPAPASTAGGATEGEDAGEPGAGDEPGESAAAEPAPEPAPPQVQPEEPGAPAEEPASAEPAPEARVVELGPLSPGTWRTGRFEPDFSFVVRRGWSSRADHPEYVGLDRRADEHLTVMRRPRYVFDPRTGEVVPAPRDLLAWMRRHPCVAEAGESFGVVIGGNPGRAFDFSIAAEPACTSAYWEIGGEIVFGFRAGERDRLVAVSVTAGGAVHELLVNTSSDDPARFEGFAEAAGKLMAGAAFE